MRSVFLLVFLFLSCYPHETVNMRYTEMGAMVFRELPVNWAFSCQFPDEDKDPVRKGFSYWNDLVGRDLFKETETCGVNDLVFKDVPRALVLFVPGESTDRAEVLATTNVGIFGGVPRSAILRYYGTWADYKSPTALESAARHEAGHVLGFGHSDYPWCLMYSEIVMEKYLRTPKDACKDEIETARRYYGKGN